MRVCMHICIYRHVCVYIHMYLRSECRIPRKAFSAPNSYVGDFQAIGSVYVMLEDLFIQRLGVGHTVRSGASTTGFW